MLLGIQIIGLLFAIGIMYFTFLHYKRKEFSKPELMFWLLIWVLFGFVTLFPGSLDFIVESLSISRTMDFFTVLGFLFLTALTIQNYLIVKKNNKKLENLVRKIAFNSAEKKK